jgi:hypothetical protein
MVELKLKFTMHLYSYNTIEGALYEFITNALDADPLNPPQFSANPSGNQIEIIDLGPGLEEEHITVIGGLSKPDPARHGSHGIGLKDAIAFCVREDLNLKIEAKCREYTFKKADPHIFLIEKPSSVTKGTKITVNVRNAKAVVERVKNRFMVFRKLRKKFSEGGIEVYERSAIFPKGAVFIKGVLKTGHVPLDFIYNFVNPSRPQKESISRDHTFVSKKFKKCFRPCIAAANPEETFGVSCCSSPPIPAISSISSSAVPVAQSTANGGDAKSSAPLAVKEMSADETLVGYVNENCMKQDHFVWTLNSGERDRIGAVLSELLNLLRKLDGLSISGTSDQGSWTKNTFLPLVSDIDLIVFIYGNSEETLAEKSQILKAELRKNEVRLEDSGRRIVNCSFHGVDFDLVLVLDPSEVNERFRKVKNNTSPFKLKMQSFMRAMKYWARRCSVKMKSCAIEEVVLELWDKIIADSGEPFRVFLKNLSVTLQLPEIKDFYDLEDVDVASIDAAAAAALRILESR